MKRFRAGTRRASPQGVVDPRVAYLLYGTLAAAYGLSVWSIIRQRHRGERAPTRATAPEVAPREGLAGGNLRRRRARRSALPELAPRELTPAARGSIFVRGGVYRYSHAAGFVSRALGRPSMRAVHAVTAGGGAISISEKNSTKGV